MDAAGVVHGPASMAGRQCLEVRIPALGLPDAGRGNVLAAASRLGSAGDGAITGLELQRYGHRDLVRPQVQTANHPELAARDALMPRGFEVGQGCGNRGGNLVIRHRRKQMLSAFVAKIDEDCRQFGHKRWPEAAGAVYCFAFDG